MNKENIAIGLLIIGGLLVIFNQFQISDTNNLILLNRVGSNSQTGINLATGIATASALDILPKGIPDVYGKELGISYDNININDQKKANDVIGKLSLLENSINLDSNQLQRYIQITGSISCEYCCGVQAITFSDGSPACGCAHSGAMRGLAKYLVTEHPEMKDMDILNEL